MSRAAVEPSSTRPTLFHIALIVPWVALIVNAFARVNDNSFLWHIRAGELQIDMGAVLTADPFSFTMNGEPWLTQSWLAEVGYGWLESSSGLAFTGVMVLALSLVTIGGIALIAYRHSRSVPATAIVVLLSTVLLNSFLVPRPVLLSYPLFVLVVLAWDDDRMRWSLPFLFWIWASVHGSFAIGLVYLGLRVLQTREWRAIRVVLLSGVMTLFTAQGAGIVSILLSFGEAGPYLDLISEWQTPDFLRPDLLPVLVGLSLIVYGATKGRLPSSSLWIFLPFVALAMSAERAVATAWVGLVPLMAMALSSMQVRWARGFKPIVAGAFCVVILLLPFVFIEPVVIDDEQFPVAAGESLDDVRTFHDDYAGGYLIWRYGPERLVYIDDRAELYQERIKEFVDIRAGRADWEAPFAEDGIEQALLREGTPLIDDLEDAGWTVGYHDEEYVVLTPGS
jgi:hypothetical protein